MEKKIRFFINLLFLLITNVNSDILQRNEGPRLNLIVNSNQNDYPNVIQTITNLSDESGINHNETLGPTSSSDSGEDFPKDLFSKRARQQGALIFHIFFGFYCFLMTAFVCNDYLLPALDFICADFNISSDVAGATFLATASCFPELFVNVVGTFLTESDLGIGTVVGSAVFNTFVTPACGALWAAEAIELKWGILSRDCIIYIISVSCLVIIMWDGVVSGYEAMMLLILFAVYFNILFFSKKIKRLFSIVFKKKKLSEEKTPNNKKNDVMPQGIYRPFIHGELLVEYRNSLVKNANLKAVVNGEANPDIKEALEVYVEPKTIFSWPSGGKMSQLWYLFTWPVRFLLFITIPDTRYKRFRKWYPVTFLMSVIWIAISSYLIAWMTTVVGDTLGIPDSIMGITFLSAGGNMPEMVSIVILSKQNNGDMAMSNTLGANTLDILLCLGLPWMIKVILSGKDVQIVSGVISYSVIAIIVCVIGFYSVTAHYKFRLNKKVGIACLCMYLMFLIFAVLIELKILTIDF